MGFLQGKRALITGIASQRSIANGIAEAMRREGADLAFTYQNEKLKSRVEDAAKEYGSDIVLPLDVSSDAEIDACFAKLGKRWDGLDILVHSVSFAPREALAGEFLDGLTRDNFRIAHDVSSYSLAALAGVLMTARIGMANRYMGEGLEMQIFIACLIGGGSIAGGKGSYIGALIGVAFIALLTNAFNLLTVPSEWQAVVIGGVLIAVVVADATMVLRKAGRPWRNIFGLRPAHIRV